MKRLGEGDRRRVFEMRVRLRVKARIRIRMGRGWPTAGKVYEQGPTGAKAL